MLKPGCGLLKVKNAIRHVRYKNPAHHWSVLRKKDMPTQKALNHFDDFYEQVYQDRWLDIRKGLLGEKKYVAVVNNFGDFENEIPNLEKLGAIDIKKLFDIEKQKYLDNEKIYVENILVNRQNQKLENKIDEVTNPIDTEISTKSNDINSGYDCSQDSSNVKNDLQDLNTSRLVDSTDALSAQILQEFIPATKIKGKEDFVLESSHYKLYDTNVELGVKIEKQYDFNYPENYKIFCFDKGNKSTFIPPKTGLTGVYNYYLMDGGSVLPVLALDVKPGNLILDMCASPGGKSLLCIQTLYPISVISNDSSYSRLKKVRGAYKQFLFDFEEKWVKTGKIVLTHSDARFIPEGCYDRILVDAPCSTDRHSLTENDNNIFKSTRIKERLQIPILQRELLVNALKLVKVGGIVVYSTCSLNPVENDGVVHMALKQIWEETNMEFLVRDMSPALRQTRQVYEFYNPKSLRYGHLVLPHLSQNYGPTYFCKLQKIN